MANASLISNVLPKLDSTIKQTLLNLLEEKGVETLEDWDYVTPEDLTPPLKLIEARKLVKKRKLPQGTIFSTYFSLTNVHPSYSTLSVFHRSSCEVDHTTLQQKI